MPSSLIRSIRCKPELTNSCPPVSPMVWLSDRLPDEVARLRLIKMSLPSGSVMGEMVRFRLGMVALRLRLGR